MDTDYGPDRRFFRLLSAIKGYNGYLIGKLTCQRICLKLSDPAEKPRQNVDKPEVFTRQVCAADSTNFGKLTASDVHSKMAQSEVLGEARVRKQRKNFVILELSGENYLLTMTLLCPRSSLRHAEPDETKVQMPDAEKKTVLPENVIARRSFTSAEILDFVQYVQDMNGIHRTADPVVPGLLMAEWFFSVLQSSDWGAMEMRFHMPAYAGQHLCLCRQSDRYDCISEETGQLFWSGRICCKFNHTRRN